MREGDRVPFDPGQLRFRPERVLLADRMEPGRRNSEVFKRYQIRFGEVCAPVGFQLALPHWDERYVPGPHDGRMQCLLRMLETSPNLERVDLVVPTDYDKYAGDFMAHHLTPTAHALPLDLKIKLAFLSVTVSRKVPLKPPGRRPTLKFTLTRNIST